MLSGFHLFDDFQWVPALGFFAYEIFTALINGKIEWLEVICPVTWNRKHFTIWFFDNIFDCLGPLTFEDITN